MEIILGKTAGFCSGIAGTVKKTQEELNKTKIRPMYCFGELAHNKQVMNNFEKQGLQVIEDIKLEYKKVIIRAHGASKNIYEQAENKNVELIDLTCPKVIKIHKTAEEYAEKEYYIILFGEKNHPEVIGTYSFCGKYRSIIEKIEDIEDVIEKINNSQKSNIAIISQTTFSLELFDQLVEHIKKLLDAKYNLEINKTICNATKIRQEETKAMSENVELMIVIGGKESSNSNKLYEISNKYCENAIFIQTDKDINIEHIKKFKKIGVMAGASTPKESINDVVDFLLT